MKIFIEYPFYFILFCIVCGIIYALLQYFNEPKLNSITLHKLYVRWILAFLRGSVVSLITFLLLNPFIRKHTDTKVKPAIAIVVDNSASIAEKTSETNRNELLQKINAIKNALSSEFLVDIYAFGNNLERSDKFAFKEKTTNLESVFSQIETNYANANLGAVILASDGIYNKGNDPLTIAKGLQVPVYSIGLGDTTLARDARIARVLYNELIYVNEPVSIQVDLLASGLQGNSIQTNAEWNGVSIAKKQHAINTNSEEIKNEITFTPTKIGVQTLRIAVPPINGETNTSNNYRTVSIHVIDAKKRVLFIAHNPNPDISALRAAIDGHSNFESDVQYFFSFNGKIDNVDLAILYQASKAGSIAKSAVDKLKVNGIATFFIEGNGINTAQFNQLQNAVNLTNKANTTNEVFAYVNKNFVGLHLPEGLSAALTKYPPAFSPFVDIKTPPNAQIILNQKIGAVQSNLPLLFSVEQQQSKTGILLAEGIWKWRLANYSLYKNHEVFDGFWSQVIQNFATKNDKRKFRVWAEKQLFSDDESILLNAELYNDNYELINTPDVQLSIINEAGKEFQATFNKTNQSYTYSQNELQEGNYTFTARTIFNNQKFEGKGSFRVEKTDIEKYNLTADFNTLRLLSQHTGGSFCMSGESEKIADTIIGNARIKPIVYTIFNNISLIDMRWILAVILALLALEWIIRKYIGSY